MKLLVCSDIHDEEAALESLSKLSLTHDYTLVCGDISSSNYFLQSCFSSLRNSFFIPGNWDNKPVNQELFKSSKCAHSTRFEIENGFNVVGFGYSSPTPYETYGELPEEEIYRQMSKLPIDNKTLLMLHCPPKGYFDLNRKGINAGSESILKIIREKKPFAAFFGHVHERVGFGQIGQTKLIKIPPANEMSAVSIMLSNDEFLCQIVHL